MYILIDCKQVIHYTKEMRFLGSLTLGHVFEYIDGHVFGYFDGYIVNI